MPLTLSQKVFIRADVCRVKFFDADARIERPNLRIALGKETEMRGEASTVSVADEDAAVIFAHNCRFRSGRRSPWIPIHFGAHVIEVMNSSNFNQLKNWVYSHMRENEYHELEEYLHGGSEDNNKSSGMVWMVPKSNSYMWAFVKNLAWRAICEVIRAYEPESAEELIRFARALQQTDSYPVEVPIVKYARGVHAGIEKVCDLRSCCCCYRRLSWMGLNRCWRKHSKPISCWKHSCNFSEVLALGSNG